MRISISGGSGRMGQAIAGCLKSGGFTLSAVGLHPVDDAAQTRAQFAALGLPEAAFTTEVAALADADAVIDFSSPAHSLAIANAVAAKGGVHVIGTTGFSGAELAELRALATKARIVQSGNYSLGVNVLEALVEKAAKLLGTEYDIEIDEMHHRHKKDAPSGTALMLGHAAARGRGVKLNDAKRMYAEGVIGERESGTIGFSVRRGGDVVGIHTVQFAGPGELIELTHQGFSRAIYANGAIKAAAWAAKQPNGFYSMRDVVGL